MLIRNCIKLFSTRLFRSRRYFTLEKRFSPVCFCQKNRFFAIEKAENSGHDVTKQPSNRPINLLDKNRPISNEDLLEKYFAGLSTDIFQKNRVYKNDLIRVINKVKELNLSSKKQGLLLIRCCTELLPDETPAVRMAILEQVWNTLKPHTEFNVDHYNELLQVYIANNRTITARTFIQQMAPVVPNITTYELILKALGEVGDLNQATEVISNMKSQNLPATESVFNSLIVCQGKSGNLQNIQEVLTMMKSLKIEYSVDTYTALARSLIWNKKEELMLSEIDKAYKSGIQFREIHIMSIVKTLASSGYHGFIPQILKYLPEQTLQTPSISPYMQSMTTLLVFQNHPTAALEMYKCLPLPSFGPKDDRGLHGRSLVRDCVKASLPSSVIALVAEELMATGRNPIALQNASEAALQQGKVPLALDLFMRLKQMGLPLRPHYFWPILIHSAKSCGEKGIMNTLSSMTTMDVKPDYETVMTYVLPYVSFTSPQNLMKKFKETGLAATTVLTPMMDTLLNSGQVRAASEICELFDAKVDAEKILKPLVKGYLMSLDLQSTVHILEDLLKKAVDKNKDWVGRFLCVFTQHHRNIADVTDFLNIVKVLDSKGLKISTSAVDYCMNKLVNCDEEKKQQLKEYLVKVTDENLVDEGEMFSNQIPHPKQMNEASLRAHLNELEAKGMNSRGVLRKLLQQYCREGNLAAAREMADRCVKEGVFLSAGMKASIFDLHVKLGEIELAELALADLNKTSPNFILDEYKVIDFATLMVYKKKFDRAFQLISDEAKKRHVVGGRNISMNCWRLLDAAAAQGAPADVRRLLQLLTSLRFCQPTNAVLGPLIRVHLKSNNIEEAVNEFVRLANKYNKTPLKHELLCRIAREMGDGREENFLINEKSNGKYSRLVQIILNIDKKIHGSNDVQLTLITVLADVGYKKSLRKVLLDPSVRFHADALLRRCERFADEKKINALETLADCAKDLRHIDVAEIYDLILDVFQVDNNCKDAILLWNRMQGADVTPTQKFIKNICSLLKANNVVIPSELAVLSVKQTKVISTQKN